MSVLPGASWCMHPLSGFIAPDDTKWPYYFLTSRSITLGAIADSFQVLAEISRGLSALKAGTELSNPNEGDQTSIDINRACARKSTSPRLRILIEHYTSFDGLKSHNP